MCFRLLRSACLVGLTAIAIGCHDPSKYNIQSPTDPNGTPLDDILAVSASPSKVPADGLTRTTVTARINSQSATRSISFETTLGTLFSGTRSSATEGGKLVLTADDRGAASVELKSEAVVGNARVTVSVGTIVRVLDVPFVPATVDGLLTLETSNDSIPADGFSLTTITARLTVSGDLRQSVKFTTSLGALVGSTNDSTNRSDATITATADGVARIFLRSENTVGTASVKAEVLGFAREIFVTFGPVTPSEVITLRAVPSQAPADGPTGNGARLTATIASAIPSRLRTVTFTTTAGQFTTDLVGGDSKKASVTADSGNVATVQLVNSSPGTASVTATVSGVSARTSVEFTRALPSTIFLEAIPGSVTAVGGASVTITVTLVRDVGQVADNTVVTYSAVDSSGTTIGTFSEVTLATVDNNDQSTNKRLKGTAKFNPDDTAATGPATITATVGSVKGTLIVQLN
jgi:hypothetical protein